jgi:hypothetical protein
LSRITDTATESRYQGSEGQPYSSENSLSEAG